MRAILARGALTVILTSLIDGSAVAQQKDVEEVEVEATRILSTKVAGRTATGVPIVNISLSYGVNIADLNLASREGADELERRVHDAAHAACKEISRQHPNATPDDAACANAAANRAMVKARELIAQAQQGR